MSGVLTLGTFDLFHRGHVRLLKRAHDLGPVTVALNRDHFITAYKGTPPVMTYQERYEVVAACKYVHAVVPNAADSKPVITAQKPRYIVIGDDWLERDYLAQLQIDRGFLAHHDISIVYVPYTGTVSTTAIRARCLASQSPSSEPSTNATTTPSPFYPGFIGTPPADQTKHGSSARQLLTLTGSEQPLDLSAHRLA